MRKQKKQKGKQLSVQSTQSSSSRKKTYTLLFVLIVLLFFVALQNNPDIAGQFTARAYSTKEVWSASCNSQTSAAAIGADFAQQMMRHGANCARTCRSIVQQSVPFTAKGLSITIKTTGCSREQLNQAVSKCMVTCPNIRR